MLELHPDAIKNFNKKAESLLKEVREYNEDRTAADSNQFRPDFYVAGFFNINKANTILRQMDPSTGEITACCFHYENKIFGLFGESYVHLTELSQGIQRTPDFRNTVSLITLSNIIFDWIKDKYIHLINDVLTDYVIMKCQEAIEEQEIWIPIAELYVQSEFQLGNVYIRPITKEHLDRWEQQALEKNSKQDAEIFIKELFAKKLKQLQGLTASVTHVVAEPKRASEIAFTETERALSALRIFSPASLFLDVTSYCVMKGQENMASAIMLKIKDSELVQLNKSTIDLTHRPWKLDNQMISDCFRGGLSELSNMLRCQKLTDFQTKILDSLSLYSRSLTSERRVDKIIYMFVSLESLLIKDRNESLVQNVAERLAIFSGSSVEERKMIIKVIKEAYRIRSDFIHHGEDIDSKDYETIASFMRYIKQFFLRLLQNCNRFTSKDEFMNTIEGAKLFTPMDVKMP